MKIYEPKGKAREYSPLALNYYKGCNHNCLYCYVPNLMCRFNSDYIHSEVIEPSEKQFKEFELSAKKMIGCNKQVLLSFTGDPYCTNNSQTTRRVLEILNFYNHKVSILTKGGLRALRDLSVFKKFGERITIGATLTFDNNKDSIKWESGASQPLDRINMLKVLHDNNIKTWASFEPVIMPEQSLNLLGMVDFVDFVKIGKINNYKGIDKAIDWKKFIINAVEICKNKDIDFYIKDDLYKQYPEIKINNNSRNKDFFNL